MNATIEPLMNDGFAGAPSKRALAYVEARKKKGDPVVGIYCGYAPLEVIRAMDAVPAILCAFSNVPIETAEAVLPSNLCPLIKSSYGFIVNGTCPFFGVSDAVIAETTCDGKKKMFELIADIKPMFVMDLPQLPDEKEASQNWTVMIRKLQGFLETTFGRKIDNERIELEIRDTNLKNALMQKLFDFGAMSPPPVHWTELYDVIYLAQVSSGAEMKPIVEECITRLEKRVREGVFFGKPAAPRVLITGCPVGGDATKIFRIIEEAGGIVVALDSCTGMKAFADTIPEGSPDPVAAIADRYLKLPCSCMTPNSRRLDELDRYIERFRPDVVIDFVLYACHSYNVESYRVGEHVKRKHGLQFLKIVTDYSDSDAGQIRTRVDAVLEMAAAFPR